jgi:hypothetical protein
MIPETLENHWSGPRWRLWSFIAGVGSVPLTILVAFVASVIAGERLVPLILLCLVVVILATSLIGSGIIDTLSSQMNRGGLARETTEDVDRALGEDRGISDVNRGDTDKDRRTIRSGLFIVAPIAAFLYFMTIV